MQRLQVALEAILDHSAAPVSRLSHYSFHPSRAPGIQPTSPKTWLFEAVQLLVSPVKISESAHPVPHTFLEYLGRASIPNAITDQRSSLWIRGECQQRYNIWKYYGVWSPIESFWAEYQFRFSIWLDEYWKHNFCIWGWVWCWQQQRCQHYQQYCELEWVRRTCYFRLSVRRRWRRIRCKCCYKLRPE